MNELHLDRNRALSFGSVAATYDRVRPTYPDALIDDLLAGSPRTVLDVGCGTGRASALFAARGCDVLGVEPDPGMAEVARGNGITVEVSNFESWDDAGRRFELVISAQAWHWVDPVAGAVKAREVLEGGRRVGLFWNMDHFAPDLRARFDAVYEREAPALASPNRTYGGSRQSRRTDVQEGLVAAGFADVELREYSWQRSYDRDTYIALLGTFSDHHLLPDEQRERLFDALGDVIDESGGTIDAPYDCHLVTAVAP